MRILIIGYGQVGKVLASLLKEHEPVKHVVCADKEPSESPDPGLQVVRVDLSQREQIQELIDAWKPTLVVNAALPRFNKAIMACCAQARVHYLDMASYWDYATDKDAVSPYKVEQLDFDEQFRKHGLIGLINAGVSPGLTNLFAAECVDELDEADQVKIRLVEDTGSDSLSFPWSKEWLLDELNWRPLTYEEGTFKTAQHFGREEIFSFPHPIGKRPVCLVSQEEIGTLPLYLDLKRVDIKAYDNQAHLLRPLLELGLTSHRKVLIKGVNITPFEFLSKALPDTPNDAKSMKDAVFAFTVEVTGVKDGEHKTIKLSAIFPTQKDIEKVSDDASFISYPTALSAFLFIKNFERIQRKGVFPPECLDKVTMKDILKEVDERINLIRG